MADVNARLEALSDGVFAITIALLMANLRLLFTAPGVFAFLLSLNVILITWVNHRAIMKLVAGTSPSVILANGFLLLTVVAIPFPTQLLARFLRTEDAAPAIVIYNAGLAAMWLGWIVLTNTMIRRRTAKDGRAAAALSRVAANSRAAFVLYSVLSITASWFPVTVALLTTFTWAFWLMASIRLRRG